VPQPAVFLDRDGTIIEEVGYPSSPDEVRLVPGAAEALARLADAGFALVVVTNQSGIARGLLTEDQLNHLHETLDDRFAARGARIEAFYACPHHPDPLVAKRRDLAVECTCRKPKPGMILQAAEDLDLDLEASWIVGDAWRDIQAGQAAGVRTVKLPAPPTQETPRPPEAAPPTAQAPDMAAAADLILAESPSHPVEAPEEVEQVQPAPTDTLRETETLPPPEPPAPPQEAAARQTEPEVDTPPNVAAPPRPRLTETPPADASAAQAPAPPREPAKPSTAQPPPVEAPQPPQPESSVPPAAPPPGASLPQAEEREQPEAPAAAFRPGEPDRPVEVPASSGPFTESAVPEAEPPAQESERPEPAEPVAAAGPLPSGDACARCGRDIARADLKAGRAAIRDGFLLCPDCLTTQPPEMGSQPSGTEGLLRAILIELRRASRPTEPEGLALTRLFAYILQTAAIASALIAALLPDSRETLLEVAIFVQLLVVALLLLEKKT
jgi:D-glycero-D-manno-heptose 1,7-bisphosphate phosphatase